MVSGVFQAAGRVTVGAEDAHSLHPCPSSVPRRRWVDAAAPCARRARPGRLWRPSAADIPDRGRPAAARTSLRAAAAQPAPVGLQAVHVAIGAAIRKDAEARAALDDLHDNLTTALAALAAQEQRLQEQTDALNAQLRTLAGSGASALQQQQPAHQPEGASKHWPAEEGTVCVIQHPGCTCCTTTHLESEGGVAVMYMRTVARADTDGALHARELMALAAQALSENAVDVTRARSRDMRDAGEASRRAHAQILDVLAHGVVVSSRPNIPSEFGHESFLVTLKHEGSTLDAIFKPRVDGDCGGWHRASIEWVAYELNLLLGMDLVPPVCGRRYDAGAMQYFVPNCVELKDTMAKCNEWGMTLERLLSDTRILDVLLQNSDRHHGNLLHGTHWLSHSPRPVLIDHAAGFRAEAFVSLDHDNAFSTGGVTSIAASTFLRLRFLDAASIANKFSGVLSDREMRSLLQRRNSILQHFDGLVEKNGYARTVLD